MPITPKFVTKTGGYADKWFPTDQFHIYTQTKVASGQTLDLVFLSGTVAFEFQSPNEDWLKEAVLFSFDNLPWLEMPEVVPNVSLAAISNGDTDDTETVGWGIDSTIVNIISAPGSSGPGGPWVIQLEPIIAAQGVESYLLRLTYYVVAMGKRSDK